MTKKKKRIRSSFRDLYTKKLGDKVRTVDLARMNFYMNKRWPRR